MNLTQMRTRVRRDLHDEDATNYRWTDSEIDRHIDHALREFSYAVPREAKATLATTAGSRDLSLASLSDLIAIEAVEYPAGKYPPVYVGFSVWAGTLTMLVDAAPSAAENVYVYYGKLHTLDASASTIPSYMEDLVAAGAAAYAAIEWASFATNRLNVGGPQAVEDYLTWGQERLAAFMQGLARQGRRGRVRTSGLYRPASPAGSQSTDWGP
ncbi:MAG: hypothetical protein HY677_05705 [Chloroflexi bacterium]|nr:hypothetical protein [Chloroflexota bacterium]